MQGSQPPFLFGTAWKEDRTEALTVQALAVGFTAVDTANQRKHYFEAGVGAALASEIAAGRRERLFIQTKFTYARGQDHRLPFDANAPVADQVRQSFASSLEHLGARYVDSYLLHGPEFSDGLTDNDWHAWGAMEELHKDGLAHAIGVSNVRPTQLQELLASAAVKPAFVQNRCYPSIAWDRETRRLCREHGVVYQGFSLIRDPAVWEGQVIGDLSKRLGKTPAQIIYRWAQQAGMLPLIGSTNRTHLSEALATSEFSLTESDMAQIEGLRGRLHR